MEIILEFIPENLSSSVQSSLGLISQKDFQTYIHANAGKSVRVVLSRAEDTPEKEQMYAYYHRVVLGVAMKVYSDDGWESVDKVKADYLLKSECGKEQLYNSKTDTESVYLLDKKAMTKDRLRKFIMDCVNYLEIERGYKVPDSESYIAKLQTGISGFQKVGK